MPKVRTTIHWDLHWGSPYLLEIATCEGITFIYQKRDRKMSNGDFKAFAAVVATENPISQAPHYPLPKSSPRPAIPFCLVFILQEY